MAQDYGNGSTLTVRVGGPYGSGSTSVKMTDITLPADGWKNAVSPYSQVVEVNGVSTNSRVDLQLSAEQTEAMAGENIAITAINDSGVVTVFAIGNKPAEDITLTATIMEVTVL